MKNFGSQGNFFQTKPLTIRKNTIREIGLSIEGGLVGG